MKKKTRNQLLFFSFIASVVILSGVLSLVEDAKYKKAKRSSMTSEELQKELDEFNRKPKQSVRSSSNFMVSGVGETWIINEENIAVMKYPIVSQTTEGFTMNLLAIVKRGDRVTVLKTKGLTWKYVSLFWESETITGWILGETVTSAEKL